MPKSSETPQAAIDIVPSASLETELSAFCSPGALDPLLEISLTPPDRLVEPEAWVGHIPFAFWIVAAHRPRTLVELGTHSGNSYGAFCQAVALLRLETKCYAVDTWSGDPQAGYYGNEVFEELQLYHDARYASFSRLVRSTFDDAAAHFPDGEIDLLHIDGYHIYDAVRHDFETWRPKLSKRGIVLFHDINVRERDFGAWRLWQELSAERPSFAFHHSHGLGILGVGDDLPQPVQWLLSAADRDAVVLRRWFARSAQAIHNELALTRAIPIARERDTLKHYLDDAVASRAELENELTHVKSAHSNLEHDIAATHQHLSELVHRLTETERARETALAQVQSLAESERARESALVEIQKLQGDRGLLLDARAYLSRQLEKERRRRQRLRRSVSWRATKPLRLVGTTLKRLAGAGRRSAKVKTKAPNREVPAQPTIAMASPPAPVVAPTLENAVYVPLVDVAPLRDPVARIIAFYLPQFHPIPENDLWWGKGFTEWTNVAKATPQFQAHYQPHLPGELGFYDLRLVETQQRQVELAKIYGISAFCFYFYWFSGKRLLERPLEQYLANLDLDLEFCLSWANENWTRRWDGKDTEILVGQDHSPEDDIAFIAEIGRYLRDHRYLQINGRPVLLVYRPALLPDASATAARWRDWCRNNGIGEIFLAYTQSFEEVSPEVYGFDAAIEFPPNQSHPQDLTDQIVPFDPASFGGRVYDWTTLVERSRNYAAADYLLYRGVCPSWDNTARRGSKGSILVNATPRLFREWVENAAVDTCQRIPQCEDRLMFVNAWNEWAEGAHLEPDRRYGYGYLEATRQGLRFARRKAESAINISAPLAVVIHAYYPELLSEILPRLQVSCHPLRIFITCSAQGRAAVQAALDAAMISDARVDIVPNRGRDVAPFLHTLRVVRTMDIPLLLKLHTKRSSHRTDGDAWRTQLYGSLLSRERSDVALTALREATGLGIVGPEGNVISMDWYKGANIERVRQLAQRMGVASLDEGRDSFVAGTMFYARTAALGPLLELDLSDANFEIETGQTDGTLAHAVERAIGYSALAAGYRLGEIRQHGGGIRCSEPDVDEPTFRFARAVE
jgi:lipopolysaccharide biosynthesis protein